MLYITLLDQFHPGIYSSQVIDVCDYLNKRYDAKIRVVAFLSVKELWNTSARKQLKALSPSAIVLPAFPKLQYFQFTAILLFFVCLITGERTAICRNIFCTRMALRLKSFGILKKIVLDGRSAMAAEIEEYDVFPVEYIRRNIREWERYSVLNADFRMSVSDKLIDYWKERYGYTGNEHIVVPCTLDGKYFSEKLDFETKELKTLKDELKIAESDIVLAYAGSTAPWQSFSLMKELLTPFLAKDNRIKVLFLSKRTKDIEGMMREFPGRIIQCWVEHKEVLKYLSCADYGILLRNQSVTNKVASPTKYAEYLYAGLSILISENLGDFTDFTKKHQCGFVMNEHTAETIDLVKTNIILKERNHDLSLGFFRKESHNNTGNYARLMAFLNRGKT